MNSGFVLVRTPSMLDTSAIVGDEARIHPEDMRELAAAYAYAWPNNGPMDHWRQSVLVIDPAADRLPRVSL